MVKIFPFVFALFDFIIIEPCEEPKINCIHNGKDMKVFKKKLYQLLVKYSKEYYLWCIESTTLNLNYTQMNTSKSIRSAVAILANALRSKKGFTASAAFKQAWKVVKAKQAMKAGKLSFSYVKKDGSLRPATGTTSPTLTGYTFRPDSEKRNYSPLYVRYYDLKAKGFRQFNAATFAA